MWFLEAGSDEADRHIDILLFQIAGSSKLILVSVLFREAFNHPYISFIHLLVNIFCVILVTQINIDTFK